MLRPILTAALMLAPQLAAAQDSFDWSGEYSGYFVCDHVENNAFGQFGRPFSLKIKQDGDTLLAAAEAVVGETDTESPSVYAGEVVRSGDGGVQAGYLEACSGRFDYKELVRLFPSTTKPDGFGFAADTIFVTRALPGLEGRLMVESCKWALQRVSTEVPQIDGC